MQNLPIILDSALPAALAAIVGSLLTFFTTRAKLLSEARKVNTEAAVMASQEWQKISNEYRERAAGQDQRIQELTDRLTKHEQKLAQQTARLQLQEERERLLTKDLKAVFDWIEGGQTPPPPVRPTYLQGGSLGH